MDKHIFPVKMKIFVSDPFNLDIPHSHRRRKTLLHLPLAFPLHRLFYHVAEPIILISSRIQDTEYIIGLQGVVHEAHSVFYFACVVVCECVCVCVC